MLLRTLSLSSLALLSNCLLALALASGWLATGLIELSGVESSLVAVFFVLPAALIWCLQGGRGGFPIQALCHFEAWLRTKRAYQKIKKCLSEKRVHSYYTHCLSFMYAALSRGCMSALWDTLPSATTWPPPSPSENTERLWLERDCITTLCLVGRGGWSGSVWWDSSSERLKVTFTALGSLCVCVCVYVCVWCVCVWCVCV